MSVAVDQTFQAILKRMVDTGQAPHYTELAGALGVSVEGGRRAQADLFAVPGFPGWLAPSTEYVQSFAPFSNVPTQYRITIEHEQKWFGQWGFESLAVSWLYPGKTVQIDAPCLDCGSPIRVTMRDGEILSTDPEGIMGYVSVPLAEWFADLAYSWSQMNLFRSEEHIRNWVGFDAAAEEGILPIEALAGAFSGSFFRRRLDDDYMSRYPEYLVELMGFMGELAKTRPFWAPPGS